MIKIMADLILRKLEGLSGLHDLRSPISSRPILVQNTECDWLRSKKWTFTVVFYCIYA